MIENTLYITLIVIAFYARHKSIQMFKEVIERKVYDFGLLYKNNPIKGDKAVSFAKKGILIINIISVYLIYFFIRVVVRMF